MVQRSRRPVLAAAFAACLVAPPCLWDSDTLATELRGLPDAQRLIVGRWHRHGDAYYQTRVERLGARADLGFAELDDLAVAYERLGDRDLAVATIDRKFALLEESDDAEHRYRALANRGTFHAHAGRFDEALVDLRAAVELNPDAHFGREKYQIELIEFVAAARENPELWKHTNFLGHAGHKMAGRESALRWKTFGPRTGEELDEKEAYTAMAGMLRFGGLEGPELYRALGDLFVSQGHLHLGWWALGRAIERGHPGAETLAGYRDQIQQHQREAEKLDRVRVGVATEEDYRKARDEADAWLARYQQLEAEAIGRGEDPGDDAVLKRLLEQADREQPESVPQEPKSLTSQPFTMLLLVGGVGALIAFLILRRR